MLTAACFQLSKLKYHEPLSNLAFNFNLRLYSQVPGIWERAAYPSLKPLGGWIIDYHKRIGFMRAWLVNGGALH